MPNPNMIKGGASINPNGRSRGMQDNARKLARYIAAQTRDGEEMADVLIAIMRSEAKLPAALMRKSAAAIALLERVAGKATVDVIHSGTIEHEHRVEGVNQAMIDAMSDDDAMALERQLAGLLEPGTAGENPIQRERSPQATAATHTERVIDAEFVELADAGPDVLT